MSSAPTNPLLSGPVIESIPESKKFAYGNPFVEKIGGVLYFYNKSPPDELLIDGCCMLCMIGVPAFFTCRELINFVSSMGKDISQMKIIRDETPNQYMVVITFKLPIHAAEFYEQFNNSEFNSIEAEKCRLLFVKRLEMASEETEESLPCDALAELPTCSVCLERMDDGILTILCNHSFHADCLSKWTDTSCPVCRHTQTPELVPDQCCSDCGKTTDLWMCLICGNIGCGRYAKAHAYNHYESTSHIFTLQVGGKQVWDYASDNFVHRLIQDSTDGKMVEHQGNSLDDRKDNEKIDAIQKMREVAERTAESDKLARLKISHLETDLQATTSENAELKEELSKLTQKKLAKTQSDLEEEKQMAELVRKHKELLLCQKEELESLSKKKISGLEEQISDLMVHFEFQEKLKQEKVTQEELDESQVELKMAESSSSTHKKSHKRGNKKSVG
uniref:BRCA1-associated protein n=1 Tax=Ditylenchus dipsaci TaxID=166011 RepID=A0A915EHN2_9BILA